MSVLPRISGREWLLRLAVAGSFVYPAIDALFDPYAWIGYFPSFLTDLVAPHGVWLLHAFGVVEIILALWLLLGSRIKIPALIMAGMLFAIVSFNLSQFPVLFRDVAIALACLSLACMPQTP